ncbi:efflux RND transporter periplasmic adaptor subunit [Patescibacteria group bacterium]|nr:efflux RND transporter periplasmic adaptor subunit [Patescibacteria group bacterium]
MKFKNPFILIWKHKIISLLVLVVLSGSGYFFYGRLHKTEASINYVTQTASKGMLVSSVSGSGQVSSSNQVDIKPKVSGDVIAVSMTVGQEVKKDDVLAKIDSGDAYRQYNDARITYENAKLELDELLAPPDDSDLLSAKNSLADAQDSLIKLEFNQTQDYNQAQKDITDAEKDLEDSYDDIYNDISDAFLDFPDILTELNTVLFSDEIADSEVTINNISNNYALENAFNNNHYDERSRFESYIDVAENNYQSAKDSYDVSFDNYRDISRYSNKDTIENLLSESIDTAKKISDALKSQINMLDFWVEYRIDKNLSVYSQVTQYQSALASYTSQANSHLSGLLSVERSLDNAKQSIDDAKENFEELKQNQPLDLASAERNLVAKQQNLDDLLAGATTLEIKNKQLSVQQKYNSFLEASSDLADHSIKAPFDGVIASVDVVVGDTVGSSAIASLITKQNIAEITLNEIDAAQVKVGQKVTLTFDAVEDLSVTGEVAEVDAIGEVNQGVVSYGVKIVFDIQDDRIKSGMSTSVNIIIESKTDILLIPIGAVKTQGSSSYVEIMDNGQIKRQTVTTGLSNDTMIEIIDGLEETQEVVTQTISSGGSSSNTSGSQSGPDERMMLRAF